MLAAHCFVAPTFGDFHHSNSGSVQQAPTMKTVEKGPQLENPTRWESGSVNNHGHDRTQDRIASNGESSHSPSKHTEATRKILVIEDDVALRKMVVMALRVNGFETIEAENGRAGVQLAGVYVPDLILSDVQMEGFDGCAALAAIRYQPLTSSIPFLLMTGYPDEKERRFAMGLGADDYLAKPFAVPDLIATIKVHLKKHENIERHALSARGVKPDQSRELAELEIEPNREESQFLFPAKRLTPAGETSAVTADAITGRMAVTEVPTVEARTDARLAHRSVDDVESLVEMNLRMLNRFHPNLGNTAMRTVVLCRAQAEVLGLSAEDSQNLCWAAALQDISLVGLDQEAVGRWLRDPRKVTEEEHAFIHDHPIESQQMLKGFPIFEAAGRIIRSHHENWNGAGYPDSLKEEKIPWLARLLAVAVGYCSQHTLGAAAIRAVKSRADAMYDPEAVESLVPAAAIAEMPVGKREIFLNQIKPGHVLAKEIRNTMGSVLLRTGRNLNEMLIQKLFAINRVAPLDQRVLVYC